MVATILWENYVIILIGRTGKALATDYGLNHPTG
jgi:hypothetical protein